MIRPFRLLAPFFVMLVMAGCEPAPAPTPERGHDPWVFRSVLDWQPRMITLALHDSLWVAYDAERAALYKAWADSVEFDGPVYTTAHGPQPVSRGDAYLVSPYREPWHVLRDGADARPAVEWRGHRLTDGQAVLLYTLVLDDGTEIAVTERPEYVEDAEGHPGLERVFTTENVPEGARVALDIHLHSLPTAESYETNGSFEAGPPAAMAALGAQAFTRDGRLVLNPNAETRFVAYFTETPQVPAEEPRRDEDKHPGLRLIERSDCQACHNAEVQTVGPSYRAIAERYPQRPEVIEELAQKIIKGGTGVWTEEIGEAIMVPHPDLHPDDAARMVEYIFTLAGEGAEAAAEEEEAGKHPLDVPGPSYPIYDDYDLAENQGVAINVYRYAEPIGEMPNPPEDQPPTYSGIVPALHAPRREDFGGIEEFFFVDATGFIDIPQTTNYVFRLVSDDGSYFYLDGEELIDNDGLHGPDPVDGEMYLQKGKHPFRVRYFQNGGGLALSLQWIAHGEEAFTVVPPEVLSHDPAALKETRAFVPAEDLVRGIPGDGQALIDVHPSFAVETIRPSWFEPKVGGLGVFDDGRVVVSTWEPDGGVYLLSNVGDTARVEVKKIAQGLLEPLGLTVVDGEIYVLQKHELTHLIDHDGDDVIDEYRTVSDDWGVTPNFHEFAFGLVYHDGHFYATLATAIEPGGASTNPQNPDRGRVVKISKDDGSVEFVAHGLRTPNGIGFGYDNELYVADNQGDWLPASKIVHIEEGAFYGSRSVDPEGTATMTETPPVVWLPQDEIGNSPSQPARLDVGPYENQMIHGEVTHGGLKRVFVEEVDGVYQGALFRFTQGLEAGVNRIAWGPDGQLYIGGIGNPGNWGHYGKNWFGLQRMRYTGDPVFEMLAVRAKADGMEIEFTEPLRPNEGHRPEDYRVQQWWYEPTIEYGGPKMDLEDLTIRAVKVSADRKKAFLELDGLKPGHVVYINIEAPLISEAGHGLWSTEAWYTLNRIPGTAGPSFTAFAPLEAAAPNQLTAAEREAGWRLLFDGQSLDGWRNYGRDTIGSAWRVENGTLTLDGAKPDTAWQFTDGGDIITDEEFEDFELSLEWKISPGGNSGIIYNIVEDPAYEYVWQTGPEMQVLDNDNHPDGVIHMHRAGDLYDLIPSRFVATRPVGAWNHVRLIQQDGRVEHWLNGQKIVEYDQNSQQWRDLIAASKFDEMPAFGRSAKGHIALQDHGDRVWYRNIKVREL